LKHERLREMKRLWVVILAATGLAFARYALAADAGTPGAAPAGKTPAAAKPSGPEILGKVKLEDVRAGMRVRIQRSVGRPFVGTVSRVSDTMVELDLSTEGSGLPGKVRFRKGDIAQVTELKPQTDEERRQVVQEREKSVAQIRIEAAERLEKRRGEETKDEEAVKTAQEEYRKALDVAVSQQREEEMRKLLEEFPPGDWGEERFRRIRENWILRDLRPTDKEIRFLSVFQDWKDARDTVAILDERQQEKEGDKLLLKFPPSEGWGQAKLSAIAEREAKGEAVPEKETEFKKVYEAWSKAVTRRAAEKPAGETPGKGEVETPQKEPVTPVNPAEEKPATTAPAEPKAAPAETPALKAPPEEKQPPAEETAPGDAKPDADGTAPADEKQPPAAEKAPPEPPQNPHGEKPQTDEKTPEAQPAAGEEAPADEKPAENAG